MADANRDAFEYINSRAIRFWKTSKEAENLIEEYFKQKEFHKLDDPYSKFKHFEFRTKSLFPDCYDLITDYFQRRYSLEIKYQYEGDLVYRLIELKKELDAVKYLEILINDYVNGKIQNLTLGDRNPQFYEGFIFDFLCFSENKDIAQKSTDLLFKLLEEKDFDTYNLYKLTAYLDKERHIKLLEKRFDDYYKNINFKPLDSKNENEQPYYKLVPNASSFFSFISEGASLLGVSRGMDLWTKFYETIPYWKHYGGPFEFAQMSVLENSFQDTKLTKEEKKEILFSAKKTERLFSDGDLYGSWSTRYLQLVLKTYPDKKVPKEDFDKLQLGNILTYSYPLNINQNSLKVVPFRIKLNDESINKIVFDLNSFAKSSNLNPIELSKKEKFALSLKSPESCIFDFFQKNESIVWFDAESFEGNYVDFYESNFLPVLKINNITDIQISQKTEKINDDEYNYKIYIKNKTTAFLFEYSEHGTDWYQPQRLVKMLNLCLMDYDTRFRFVEIESGDQTAIFILTEPSKMKPLLDKYNIGCWAINYNDDFHNINR